MAPSSALSQRSLVAQFVNFTQAKESVALKHLKHNSWNVEQAVNAFYNGLRGDQGPVSSTSQQNLSKLFDNYRDHEDTEPDRIKINGAQAYLNDLAVGLEELVHLAVCELLQSPSIGEFCRDSFISGWQSLPRVTTKQIYDTIPAQADHVRSMRSQLQTDLSYLKRVYRYSFSLARPEGQKNVPMDAAVEFWKMFFGAEPGGIGWNTASTPWLDWWLEFYQFHHKRPVNKDLWNMVGELVDKTREPGGENLAWWSEDGAWPMAVDEFIAFVKEKRGDIDMTMSP